MFLGTRRALSTQYQPGHSLQADQGDTEDVQDQGGRREREGWPRWTGSGTVAEQYSKICVVIQVRKNKIYRHKLHWCGQTNTVAINLNMMVVVIIYGLPHYHLNITFT